MFLLAPPDMPVVTLKPAVDIRERFERRTDKDFNKAVNDNSDILYSRARFIVNLAYGQNVTGQLSFRYTNDATYTVAKDSTAERSDIEHAYIAIKQPLGTWTLGRQEVVKGAGKLLGTAEFTQIAKVYDGVRLTNKKWDVFAGKFEINSTPNPAAWYGMVCYTSGLGESMFIAKQDEAAVKDLEIYTIDQRYIGTYGKWVATAEGAYQFGKNQAKDQDAWAAHANLAYKITPKLSVFAEGNMASGGSSATKVHTFDQLNAGNHWWYGQMDMQGWANMQHIEAGITYNPDKKLALALQWHNFELMNSKDGWYGSSGSVNSRVGGKFVDASGLSGRDLGQEIDFNGTYMLNRDLQLQFGAAMFQPGGFIKAFNGSNTDDQYWLYFGITAKY